VLGEWTAISLADLPKGFTGAFNVIQMKCRKAKNFRYLVQKLAVTDQLLGKFDGFERLVVGNCCDCLDVRVAIFLFRCEFAPNTVDQLAVAGISVCRCQQNCLRDCAIDHQRRLRSSSRFMPVDPSSVAANDATATHSPGVPQFEIWRAAGVQVLVTGRVELTNEKLKAEFFVWDVATGKVLAQAYVGRPDERLQISHAISSIIYDFARGNPRYVRFPAKHSLAWRSCVAVMNSPSPGA
jgi:hypothetical protein